MTEDEFVFIVNRLNHRPRKCLDFETPFDVFFEWSVALDRRFHETFGASELQVINKGRGL